MMYGLTEYKMKIIVKVAKRYMEILPSNDIQKPLLVF